MLKFSEHWTQTPERLIMDIQKTVFVDRTHTRLRLVEAAAGVLFLVGTLSFAPLQDAEAMLIPLFLIPTAILFDGLVRYNVLKKGIVVDPAGDRLEYPAAYTRKSLPLSGIHSLSVSKSYHSGAQFGSGTYSYDLNLQGDFGTETLVFASKASRDEMKRTIQNVATLETE